MLTVLSFRNVAVPNKLLRLNVANTSCKMSDWQTEKQKYLAMDVATKRKQYDAAKYYTVDDIPTWKEYAKARQKLADEIPVLSKNKINAQMNEELADKISIFKGNIVSLEIDVIVNAANKWLKGGGGVDGAIHRAANKTILSKECSSLNGCKVGEAKLTGGYRLPAKYIIHTVGPIGEKPDLLEQCYRNSLKIMLQEKFRTIAFPCISTGVYGYPLEPAAHVAIMEVRKHLEEHPNEVDRVIFCLFTDGDEQVYQGALQTYFPVN